MLLAKAGAEVTVIEKQPRAGGRTSAIEGDFIMKSVMFQSHVAMVSANQAYGGGTMVGNVPAEILTRSPHGKESYITAELDLSKVRQARRLSRNFRQRRPDLYGRLTKAMLIGDDGAAPKTETDRAQVQAPPAGKLRVASCQFPVSSDVAHNGAWIRKFMREAQEAGAHLWHTSEVSLSGYAGTDFDSFENYDWQRLREETRAIRPLAQELHLWLVLGSAHYLDADTLRRQPPLGRRQQFICPSFPLDVLCRASRGHDCPAIAPKSAGNAAARLPGRLVGRGLIPQPSAVAGPRRRTFHFWNREHACPSGRSDVTAVTLI